MCSCKTCAILLSRISPEVRWTQELWLFQLPPASWPVLSASYEIPTGPLVAMFYQLFGARLCIFAGGLLAALGFFLGSIATSIYPLYCFSILIGRHYIPHCSPSGLGGGLIRNSIISVQCEYFDVNRNFVISFMAIGPGLGILMLPNIFKSLLANVS